MISKEYSTLAILLLAISAAVHLVMSQVEDKCRRYMFNSVNSSLLNQTITDSFINQTLECIAESRGGDYSELDCYNCEEFVCAMNCLVLSVGNVSMM